MMNNDNAITPETRLYAYIAENAQSSRFSVILNGLFKASGVDAMMIPMNIRPDDATFTLSQMRTSKLSGAYIASEYQEEAFGLLDDATDAATGEGVCDVIRVEQGRLMGDRITHAALMRYADDPAFQDDVAVRATVRYLFDLITGEMR